MFGYLEFFSVFIQYCSWYPRNQETAHLRTNQLPLHEQRRQRFLIVVCLSPQIAVVLDRVVTASVPVPPALFHTPERIIKIYAVGFLGLVGFVEYQNTFRRLPII